MKKENPIANEIHGYWQQLLHLDTVEIQDDFFELGGDALLFKGLKQKVEQHFRINISNLTKTNFSTFYQQESLIKELINVEQRKIILTLQKGEKHHDIPTIIAIHPIGGSLFPFMPLIINMKSNNRIYGIQDPALTGDMRLFNSIAEQVRFYISELKKELNPNEKIIVMGYSSGGVVANEMTYQLNKTQAFMVQHVVLFDSWTRMPSSISFRDSVPSIIKRNFEKLKPDIFFKTQEEIDYWLYKIIWDRMRIAFLHKPKQMNAHTTLFVPTESVPEYTVDKKMTEGWAHFTPKLYIQHVNGNHENMLDQPDLTSIIRTLKPIFNSKNQ